MKSKTLNAFTMLELVVVMLVSGLLLSLVYTVLQGAGRRYLLFARNHHYQAADVSS